MQQKWPANCQQNISLKIIKQKKGKKKKNSNRSQLKLAARTTYLMIKSLQWL